MNFIWIDLNIWNCREYFVFYCQQIKCGFSLIIKFDIIVLCIVLVEIGYKFYLLMIYLIFWVVNQFLEFWMVLKDNEFIYWDQLDLVFIVFYKEIEIFFVLFCCYFLDFSEFMVGYNVVMVEYQYDIRLFLQGNLLENYLNILLLLWVSFDGFNLNIIGNDDYFVLVFMMVKFQQEGDCVLLFVFVQVYYVVCDGFYVVWFINIFQLMCDNILK